MKVASPKHLLPCARPRFWLLVLLTCLLLPWLLSALACKAVTRLGAILLTSTPTATATAAVTPTFTYTPLPTFTFTPTSTPTSSPTVTPIPFSPTPTSGERTLPLRLQLRVFETLWTAVKQNYLYPDFNGLDWEAIHDEYRQRITAGLGDEAFYLAMDEMIFRLGDEHSIYFSPQEAEELDAEFAGEYDFVGIGVYTSVVVERQLATILLVFPNSPAAQAGLAAHDNLLAVDGRPIVDEQGFHVDRLRGPEGSLVELTVQSPGEAPRQVSVTRQRITGLLPVPHQVMTTPGGRRVGYLFLVTFSDNTVDEQVAQALQALVADGPLDGLIIDNRFNSGGASTIFDNILAYFSHGLMGHFIHRQEQRPLQVIGKDINGSQEVPLVVLVGSETASFGEIFAGVLKDIGRAYLVGEPSDGNVEILRVYNFVDGSRAWIAFETFRPLNHPEQDWEQSGILPDLQVTSNWDESTLETDAAVQAALEYFDNH